MAFPLMLAIGAGAGLAAGGIDAWRMNQLADEQQRKADALRYEDKTPLAMREAIATSRMAQGANMPGYNSAANNIMQATAGQTRALQQNARGSSMIGGLQNLAYSSNRAFSNLANQNAQFQVGERRNLQGLLGQQAGLQEGYRKEFERGRAALNQAAIQNRENAWRALTGSLAGIGQSAAGIGANQMAMQSFNAMNAGGMPTTPTSVNTGMSAMPSGAAWNPNMMGLRDYEMMTDPSRAMFRGSLNRQPYIPMAGFGQ